MASEITTRSGLTPNENGLPFSVTTTDVEKYLQRKVDIVVNKMNKEGQNIDSVEVRVYTTEPGSKFVPFVVILPMAVLKNTGKKHQNAEPSIFNPKTEDRSADMLDPFFNLFKAYVYNKDDEQAFFAEDWRRARGVARDTSPLLKSLRLPKVNKMDNGRIQVVSFMIDPLRIFHDMLVMDSQPRDFKVDINGWQKIKTGEYRYDIKRCANKKNKKKYRDTFADELNRKMRSGGRY